MKHDKIVHQRVLALAEDHGLTVPETLAALDKHPIETDRDTYLKRTLALELIELDRLAAVFRVKAFAGDTASAAILLKVAERRATLLGMNAPQGHAVQIVQHEPAAAQTSTEKIRAAIDRIRGKSLPRPDGSDDPNKLN